MIAALILSVGSLLSDAKANDTLDDAALSQVTERVLAEHKISGSFVLYDEQRQLFLRSDPQRSRQAQTPASTFKIFNALVALETGVVSNPQQVIVWDGVERQIKAWNQDQTLVTGMKHSAVWVFQRIARLVGRATMQRFLNQVGYGNGRIGEQIDRFWLDGSLKITPQQQVEFLRRLYHHQLPFDQRHMTAVKDMIVRKRGDRSRLSGKTGWEVRSETDQGWFVGYLERDHRVWFFALHVEIHSDGRGRNRQGITEQILMELGLQQI